MRLPSFARQFSQSLTERDILSHWVWAVPVLLIVAALTMRQIDMNPPTTDELYSMSSAGWIVDDRFTLSEVLHSVTVVNVGHTPLYFLLLNLWGILTGIDVATGRVLAIFFGLLALCVIYRLGRDFVAPPAGLFAIIMVTSNAFFNYYFAHLRMYSLLVLISSLVLWLYLRVIYRPTTGTRRSGIAFFVSTLLLFHTHIFGTLLLLALGVYHLLFAPKDRRWVAVSLAAFAATALFLPWLRIILTWALSLPPEDYPSSTATVGEILQIWLSISFNGSPVLLAIAVIAVWVACQESSGQDRSIHRIALLFLPVIGFVAYVTGGLIRASTMRMLLPSLPAMTMISAVGVAALFRIRQLLGLLVILWVVAGISFQSSPELSAYFNSGRLKPFTWPGWHAVSRLALQTEQRPMFIGYGFRNIDLMGTTSVGISHFKHFFGDLDVTVRVAERLQLLDDYAGANAISEPIVWVFYRSSQVEIESPSELQSVMERLDYQLCAETTVGYETVILQFRWDALGCGAPEVVASYQTQSIEYELYATSIQPEAQKLYFVDRWTTQDDSAFADFHFSHQLLDEDWERVAQLDVPLVHEGKLRRFSIDAGEVPPGKYRLMAILYNPQTGEQIPWIGNAGYVPEMLTLGEVVLD